MSLDWSGYDGVEMIPGKVGGVPLLKNSRVPADLVADCLEDGETVEEVSYNYDLNPLDVARLKQYIEVHQPVLRR